MNRQLKYGIINYGLAAIITAIIGYVYTLFGHGVSSRSMSFMFFYPILGGILYIILNRSHHFIHKTYLTAFDRIGLISLHLGILTVTTGSFIKGILDIAGTGSIYIGGFYIVAAVLICGSIGSTLYKMKQNKKELT